jgi:hypothetical protein
LGVAPRRLWGWEPRQFTAYEYDGDRIVGTVTTLEPEFDGEQLALLRAYMDLTGDRGSHGLPLSETTHPDANPAVRGGWHYEANESPRIDYAGQAIGKAQDAYYKAHPDEPRGGHGWYARRVDD